MDDDYTSAGPVVIQTPGQESFVRWPYTRAEFADIVFPTERVADFPVEVPVGL